MWLQDFLCTHTQKVTYLFQKHCYLDIFCLKTFYENPWHLCSKLWFLRWNNNISFNFTQEMKLPCISNRFLISWTKSNSGRVVSLTVKMLIKTAESCTGVSGADSRSVSGPHTPATQTLGCGDGGAQGWVTVTHAGDADWLPGFQRPPGPVRCSLLQIFGKWTRWE